MTVIKKIKLTEGDIENMLLNLYEQAKEEEASPEDTPKDENKENPQQDSENDENPDSTDLGSDQYGGEDQSEDSLEKIGRMYELKRIHYRLLNIQTHLDNYTDEKLANIKDYVGRALDLFKLVINNYDKYEQKIDDVILLFYQFLSQVYDSVKQQIKTLK